MFDKLWKNRLESKWLDKIWWNFAWCTNCVFELLLKNKICIKNPFEFIKQPSVQVVHKLLVNGWAWERVTHFILLRFIYVFVRIEAIIWVAKFKRNDKLSTPFTVMKGWAFISFIVHSLKCDNNFFFTSRYWQA